jgi:Domain of unknown function (DUF4145)
VARNNVSQSEVSRICIRGRDLNEVFQDGKWVTRDRRHSWQLVPAAEMQVFPDYVPPAVVADYKEACLIATLSPKASATLARRALQGMIRDYWGVKPGRLVDEIEAIHERVDADAWQAIDGLRKIGNIGAHMEHDINVIVDVDPNEARLLIGLIETLVQEWYIAREERKSRFAKLADLAREKVLARKRDSAPSTNENE